MRRAFRYRLWTNANQERELAAMLESHRRLWNEVLSLRQMTWDCYRETFSYCDSSRWFRAQRDSNPFFARLNFSSAQATLRRLDRAFRNFFRRCAPGDKPGYPRFKGKDREGSIEFPAYRDGIRLTGNRLYVQHVGTIRVKLHRLIEGVIKTVILKREAGKWYVVFSCALPDMPPRDEGKPAVGIDVGLEAFLTTSAGERQPNPRYLKDALPDLRRAGRAVSRKQKGSSNRRRAVRRLQKVHAWVRHLRHDHHHKVALSLVRRYGFLAVERLNVRGMLGNRRLSRAIQDVGWSGFLGVLRHKAESAGARFVAVDPRGTSQECVCGQEVRKALSERWHRCAACGLSAPRDHVSAQVILARGLAARTGPLPANAGHRPKRPARSRRL
jgi:putative transposase